MELEPLTWPRDCPQSGRTGFIVIIAVFIAAAVDLAALSVAVLQAGLMWRTLAIGVAVPATLIAVVAMGLAVLTDGRRRRKRRRTVRDVNARSVAAPLPVIRRG